MSDQLDGDPPLCATYFVMANQCLPRCLNNKPDQTLFFPIQIKRKNSGVGMQDYAKTSSLGMHAPVSHKLYVEALKFLYSTCKILTGKILTMQV